MGLTVSYLLGIPLAARALYTSFHILLTHRLAAAGDGAQLGLGAGQ
jgi:hypothetical protein